jgi:hypothetical protein
MSRTFVRASSQFLEKASSVITAYPYTLSVWVNPASTANAMSALSVGATVGADYIVIGMNGTVGAGKVFFEVTGGVDANGTTVLSAGTWNHLAAVGVSATSRILYVNGVQDGTNTTSVAITAANLNTNTIGALENAGARVSFFDGSIAEAGMWNAALTADEIKRLAKGKPPLDIRPSKLVVYAPVTGTASPEIDVQNNTGFTVSGATAGATNPPMAYNSAAAPLRPAIFKPGLAR